tara:strand:- start:4101 stop:4349 length:249 start_codon:yes stop_codon:yes gene_type:complete
MKHLGQLNRLLLTQLEMKHSKNKEKMKKTKYHKCGCHVINSSGKKVFLKSNVNYHGTHKPRLLLDQRITDKANREYIKSNKL